MTKACLLMGDTDYDTGYGGEYDERGRLADSFNDSL